MSKQSNKTVARAVVSELKAGRSIARVSAIIRDIEKQLLDQDETLYVHVTSAHDLSAAIKEEISDMFRNQSDAKHIHLEETINPDVIGGVRCETAEHRLDLTVRRQLQRLKGSAA